MNKPERIQHLCHRQNMPSEHCRGTFGQGHVSAGRKHVKGRCEICLELYPAQKPTSRILLIAGTNMQLAQELYYECMFTKEVAFNKNPTVYLQRLIKKCILSISLCSILKTIRNYDDFAQQNHDKNYHQLDINEYKTNLNPL